MLRELHKASVAWNNSYRQIFSRCWGEIVQPLQYCQALPWYCTLYFGKKC